MAFLPRSYAQDLAGLQSNRTTAQLQLEQMRLQREQQVLQAEQASRVADAARTAAIGDILNNSLGAVIGGMSNAEKMELAKRDTARQENLAAEQIASSKADRAQTELKNAQENIRLQAIGRLAADAGIKSAISPTIPTVVETPMTFTPIAQPEWRAAKNMQDLVAPGLQTQKDMRSTKELGVTRVLPRALGITPPVSPPADTLVDQQKIISDTLSAPTAPLFATAEVPSTAFAPQFTPVTTQPAPVATTPEPVRNISDIGDTIFNGLSDDDKRRLGYDAARPESEQSAKNIVRGMVAAEANQQDALRMQQKRLELGMIKDQYDLDQAKRAVAIDVIKNSITSATTYDPSFVRGILENDAVRQSGISAAEIDGLSRKYFDSENKEKAKFELEKSLTQAQIKNQSANAAESYARSSLISAQAKNLPKEQELKTAIQNQKNAKAALDEATRQKREQAALANTSADNARADLSLIMKAWQNEFHNFDFKSLVSSAARGDARAQYDLERYYKSLGYDDAKAESDKAIADQKEKAATKDAKR